ncbi:MAG: glycoside hydrolase family 16 protein [Caldilineae bacterium]|nr:MAG: glycoside hydrolase family 16 protein [Caldilineae bacterium]
MYRRLFLLLSLVVLAAACAPQAAPVPSPTSTPTPIPAPAGRELMWHDEFDGESLNPADWNIETGAGGWGNNELQFYTDRPENLRLEDGVLVIEARQEDYKGSRYTSARINTQYKHAFRYGRIEARLKLPTGKGIWPAFWMLGEDLPRAGWPAAGEIDIMENIGEPHTVYGTVHGPGYSGAGGVGAPYTVAGAALTQDFHTYAIEWAPGEIRWYLDDALFNIVDEGDVPGPWVYDHPFFIILNLAVGGNWPGNPDANTRFPQQLLVDYVRVYRNPGLELGPRLSLHAADVRLSLTQTGDAVQAEGWITVVDQDGRPVEGAVVTVGWLGVVHGATAEAATDAEGLAGPFVGRMVSRANEVSLCISDIRKAGADYDKSQNVTTCAFESP